MFKKEIKISGQHQIGKQDRDKIRDDMIKVFNKESSLHFAKSFKKLEQLKVQGKNGGTQLYIFVNDDIPLLVDPSKKGDYFPTVYTCRALPDLIPTVKINKGVEEFIYKGANLMWPGVSNKDELGEFNNDDLRRIVSSDGVVIAIGAMATNSKELEEEENQDEGICCHILHHNKDKLYELGQDKQMEEIWSFEQQKKHDDEEKKRLEELEAIKNAQKNQDNSQQNQDQNEDDEENDEIAMANFLGIKAGNKGQKIKYEQKKKQNIFKEEELEQQNSKQKKGKQDKKNKKHSEEQEEAASDEEEQNEEQDKKNKNKGKQQQKKTNPKKESAQLEEGEEGGAGSEVNVKEIDSQIREAFLNAVKLSIDDKMLPIDPSLFYSQHMQNCKGENVKILDFKNSSHKKIGVYMNYLKKNNFIEYKEGKKGAAPMITSINRQHKEIENWEVTIGKVNKKDEDKDQKEQDSTFVAKIKIDEAFRPNMEVAQIFGGPESVKKLFTQQEIQNMLTDYIKKNCKQEKKMIVLDPYLAKLFPPEEESDDEPEQAQIPNGDDDEQQAQVKPKKQKNVKIVDAVTKERLGKKVESKLQLCHTITNSKGEIKTNNFAFKGIQVITEKAHNKNITRIVGLEQFEIDLELLSNKFQVLFACSCTTSESHNKNLGKDLIVQGNNLTEIVEFLQNECKIDKKYIQEQDKLGQAAKKKQKGGFQK